MLARVASSGIDEQVLAICGWPVGLRCRPRWVSTACGTGRYWQLNPTGAHVVHALAAGHHPDDIAAHLATRYHIDLQQAQHDITALTEGLHAAKLVAPS